MSVARCADGRFRHLGETSAGESASCAATRVVRSRAGGQTCSGGVENRCISRSLSASEAFTALDPRDASLVRRYYGVSGQAPFFSTNWPPILACPRPVSAKSFASRSRRFLDRV
jgi:hypothetical protein